MGAACVSKIKGKGKKEKDEEENGENGIPILKFNPNILE